MALCEETPTDERLTVVVVSSALPWLLYVNLAIALYGAGLATVNLVRQRTRDKPRLYVECGFGYQPRAEGAAADDVVPVITLEGRNIGHRPIEVQGAGFLCNGQRVETLPRHAVQPGPLAQVLGDGESVRIHYSTSGDVPPSRTMCADRVYLRAGGEVWEATPPEWLQPLTLERRWPHG